MRSKKLKPPPFTHLFAMVVVMFACWPAFSAQAVPSAERDRKSDGIKGLIVNQTITEHGYAFYQIFTELWREKPDGENYSLNIVERPSKRYGNQVQVFFGQRRVYAGVVPYKYDRIRPACEKAVEESFSNIVLIGMENPSVGDPDIAKDEF